LQLISTSQVPDLGVAFEYHRQIKTPLNFRAIGRPALEDIWQPLTFGSWTMISGLLPIVILWLVGFACGYGVREYIARRRHAADREKFYQEHPELHRLRGL
jgi:hypothetical protein